MQQVNTFNHVNYHSFKPMNWLKDNSVWSGCLA